MKGTRAISCGKRVCDEWPSPKLYMYAGGSMSTDQFQQ